MKWKIYSFGEKNPLVLTKHDLSDMAFEWK